MGVGPAQRLLLTFRARSGERQVAAIRRPGHAAQNGINPASLGLGIGQTAQDDQRQPF